MKSNQPVSQQSDSEAATSGQLDESTNTARSQSSEEHDNAVKPDVAYLITQEALRALIDEKNKRSTLHAILAEPLVVVLAGGLMAGVLTHYYTYRQKDVDYNRSLIQQELTRRQSFSDELNKTRVQKLGELWGRLDEDEFTINRLLDESAFEDSISKDKSADQVRRLIQDDQVMATRCRFWLGEELFQKTTAYLDMNVKYALNKLMTPSGTDLIDVMKKRDDAKQDILKIRNTFLTGESNP
jgi:hypothetical protein